MCHAVSATDKEVIEYSFWEVNRNAVERMVQAGPVAARRGWGREIEWQTGVKMDTNSHTIFALVCIIATPLQAPFYISPCTAALQVL